MAEVTTLVKRVNIVCNLYSHSFQEQSCEGNNYISKITHSPIQVIE